MCTMNTLFLRKLFFLENDVWTVYALVVNVGYTSCWFCNLYLLFSRIVFCAGGRDDDLCLGIC